MAKIALILNGDTERRHLDNVDRAFKTLHDSGFTTFVASPKRPEGIDSQDFSLLRLLSLGFCQPASPIDYYAEPTLENIKKLVGTLKANMHGEDELVIYTTGHGDQEKGVGKLCLSAGGECDAETMAPLLDGIPFKQRTVIMDQCYSGNWNKLFVDDPRTLFVSAGSRGEEDRCQELAPRFWSDKAIDLNKDGVISWQERYAYAMEEKPSASLPQFVSSTGYREAGRSPFPTEVAEVSDRESLEIALKSLKPGQYAIITFSASWCKPCQAYRPEFETMAAKGEGQHLWMHTENEDLAKQYGVNSYPTVMALTGEGKRFVILDRMNVANELAQYEMPLEERFFEKLARIRSNTNLDPLNKAELLRNVASSLAATGNSEKPLEALEEALVESRKVGDTSKRAQVLAEIASTFKILGYTEKVSQIFQESIDATSKIDSDYTRIFQLLGIASRLTDAGFKEKAAEVYKEAVKVAQTVKNNDTRKFLLKAIASSVAAVDLKELVSVPSF